MKRLINILALIVLFTCQLNAQTQFDYMKQKYDSLMSINNKPEALKITKQMNQWALENEGDTSLNYAVSFRYIGNCFQANDSALKYYELSKLSLIKQGRVNDVEYGNCINNIGLRYIELNRYEDAKEMIENALDIYKINPGIISPRYKNTLNALGNLYNDLGNYPEAINCYSSVIKIMDSLKIKDNNKLLFINARIAYLYKITSNFEQAEIWYNRKVELTRTSKDKSQVDLADAIDQLGDVLLELKKYDEAESKYTEALHIRVDTLGKNHPDVAFSYSNFANLYLKKNEYKKAILYYLEDINILKSDTIIYKHDLGASYNNLANLYAELQNHKESIKYLKEAINIFEQAPDSQDILDLANSYNGIGVEYSLSYDFVNAEYYINKALKIQGMVLGENNEHYAGTICTLGLLNQQKGDYTKALKYYFQSKEIFENKLSVNNPSYLVPIINIGTVYKEIDNIDSAEKFMLLALETTDVLYGKEHYEYAKCLHNLAILYKDKGNYQLAEKYSQSSLNINKGIYGFKSQQVASSLQTLGNLNEKTGDILSAKKNLEMALLINIDLYGAQNSECPDIMSDFAHILIVNEEYKLAEDYLQKALKIIKKIKGIEHPDYAECLNNLAMLNSVIGKNKKAEAYYKKSMKLITKQYGIESQFLLLPMKCLCLNYSDKGKCNQAENYLKKILKINKQIYGEASIPFANSLQYCGQLYLSMNNLVKAEEFYTLALHFRNKISADLFYDDMLAYGSLADINRKKNNHPFALDYYVKAVEMARKDMYTNFIWRSAMQKDKYWSSRIGEFNFNYLYYFTLCKQQILDNATQLSYNTSLFTRSVILSDAQDFQKHINSCNDTETKIIYKEYLKTKQYLLNYDFNKNNDIKDSLQLKLNVLNKILINSVGDYAALKSRLYINWFEVKTNLKEHEVAIEFNRYYDYDDSTYNYMAQVLRPNYENPHIVKLGSEKEIEKYKAGNGLSELYHLVWEPIDSLLQGVETVYYSPDGILYSVPFHALCMNDSSGCNYLMDKYTLHQLSTTRYLADSTLTNIKSLNNTIVLFGGINYDIVNDTSSTNHEESNEDFILANTLKRETKFSAVNYLPGTKQEVESVVPLFNKNKWNTTIATGSQASEQLFKSYSDTLAPSIIHIATHGFAFPDKEESKMKNKMDMLMLINNQQQYTAAEDPMMRCGLMFAGANKSWTGKQKEMIEQTGQDGVLTAAEVANMDLSNTKLVVLSACETGLGKVEGSEGVFGLQRGFKLAGVEQLIVSLWKVPDRETMELMNLFYTDLTITKDPVVSFSKAQKQMRNNYPDNPEKWAGFVLVR